MILPKEIIMSTSLFCHIVTSSDDTNVPFNCNQRTTIRDKRETCVCVCVLGGGGGGGGGGAVSV